jgi:hypothetical protein
LGKNNKKELLDEKVTKIGKKQQKNSWMKNWEKQQKNSWMKNWEKQ